MYLLINLMYIYVKCNDVPVSITVTDKTNEKKKKRKVT